MASWYIESSKIHTNSPEGLKSGLKRSQEDTLDDPSCPKKIFFKNWGVGVLNFSLSVKNGKNGTIFDR